MPETIFRCPNCLGALANARCTECGVQYQQTLGILDLRWPHPGPPAAGESEQIAKFVEKYKKSTFAELVALRFHNSNLPTNIVSDYQRYNTDSVARSRQMLDMFQRNIVEKFGLYNTNTVLDLGCGVGASSIVLSAQFDRVIGIDVNIISLLLARKYLEERHITNVALAQAYGQRVPLPDAVVDYAVAQNVLEHLMEVEEALLEVRRVLVDGGCFCGDSRNRFDIFFPEPHTKLYWVGFWPRRWQAWYVWQFRKMAYKHTRLLSFPELKKYGACAFGSEAYVELPAGAAYGRSPGWDRLIGFIERVPPLKWLISWFYPSLLLVARAVPGD